MGMFTKATKAKSYLRLAVTGPAGSGKTWSALQIATHLLPEGGKIGLIDSEYGSASKYAGDFDFYVVELNGDHSPEKYIAAIKAAQEEGFDLLIIDSLTHAWDGKNGILEQVERAKSSGSNKNEFAAWGKATPLHKRLIDAMLGSKMHIIATMRSKTEYAVESENGKTRVTKVGTKPIQRDGMEFEFDIVGDMDTSNTMQISKTRCSALQGQTYHQPGEEVATIIRDWLDAGTGERKAATVNDERTTPYSPEVLIDKYQKALAIANQKDPARLDDLRSTIVDTLVSRSGLGEKDITTFVKALCEIEVLSLDLTIPMATTLSRMANATSETLKTEITGYLAFVTKSAQPKGEEVGGEALV